MRDYLINERENFGVRHYPYMPKMNGAVEAANKNIKKVVQKMVVIVLRHEH